MKIRFLLAAAVLSIVTAPPPASVWSAQDSGTSVPLRAVDFIDTLHGWAVGDPTADGGEILVTNDGGATWAHQASLGDADLQAVDFVDAQHGWVGGGFGIVYVTDDGGQSWTHQTLPEFSGSSAVFALKFVDTQHGWVVGQNGSAYNTVDGGATWTRQLTYAFPNCHHLEAVSPMKAWIGCDSGLLLSTSDGGASWPAQFPFGPGISETINVDFIDDLHGWAISTFGLKKTVDGGQTWTTQNAVNPQFKQDVVFTDALHGWLIGYNGFSSGPTGVISATVDGGATWTVQVPDSAGQPILNAGSFPDETHGWVVGLNGTLLSYLPDTGMRALTVVKLGNASGDVSSSPAGIDCGSTCKAEFVTGTSVTLTATPSADAAFTGWSGPCAGTSTCTVSVDDMVMVGATFKPTYPLSVAKAGPGTGLVSASNGGIACGSTCDDVVLVGSIVTFTATADAGSWFAGWSGACNSTGPTCTVQANHAVAVTATFESGAPPAPPVITPGVWRAQPSATTRRLRGVDFVDGAHGWAVGDGAFVDGDIGRILVTSDGGATWTIQFDVPDADMSSVDFVDLQHGWAAGGYGVVYATSDGGATWARQYLPPTSLSFAVQDVSFADLQHGWVVGNQGTVYATVDGGAHWATQLSGTGATCYVVQAVTAMTAWRGCDSGSVVVTRDGGATWDVQFPFGVSSQFQVQNVSFVDDQRGWIASPYELRKTTDGGFTWTTQSAPVTMQGLVFTDAAHGWAVGSSGLSPNVAGVIVATVDGGAHWTAQVPFAAGNKPLNAVAFSDANHGWAVGIDGTILGYGPDTGTRGLTVAKAGSGTGSVVSNPAAIDCGQSCFAEFVKDSVVTLTPTPDAGSMFVGWSTGCSGTGPCSVTLDQTRTVTATFKLLYSVDVGVNGAGLVQSVPSGINCAATCSASFADGTIVTLTATAGAGSWFAGWSGACNTAAPTCTVVATSTLNATATFSPGAPPPPFEYLYGEWFVQDSGTTRDLKAVDFVDAAHGWAVGIGALEDGEAGQVLVTTDGGETWTKQFSAPDADLWSVDFVDLQHGWAVGGYGVVYATSDGGATWARQTLPPDSLSHALQDVSFADVQHGWIVGIQGAVYATVDGGAHWDAQVFAGSASCYVVQAVTAMTAWRGCDAGLAFVTRDGGATWTPQFPFGFSQQYPIAGLSFIDDQRGWLATPFEMRKTTNGGLTWTTSFAGGAPQGVVFTDMTHGWRLGYAGSYPNQTAVIQATADGAAHWTLQVPASAGHRILTGMSFADGNHGWAVGLGGTILVYRPVDITPPVISASVIGTLGSNGWYVDPVQIAWTVTDPQSSVSTTGCAPVTVSSETPGVSFTCSATSQGGTASNVQSVKVDLLPPMLTAPADVNIGTPNAGGITVSYAAASATDATSGLAAPPSCAPASGSLFPIGTTLVTCSVSDRAGRSASAFFHVNVTLVDATPPSIVATVSGTLGSNGWYRSDVAISWIVTDGESTIGSATGCNTTTIAADTASQTLTCIATSAGGTASQSVTIKRDATAPSLATSGDLSAASTSASGATVNYAAPTAADATSGLAGSPSCTPASGSTFAVGPTTVTCAAADNAGNGAAKSFTITVTDVVSSGEPGRLSGAGHVMVGDDRVQFDMSVLERPTGAERGRVDIRIKDGRRGHQGDDRFDARTVSDVTFSNAPEYGPGRNSRTAIDTVIFRGTGKWDRQDGFSYVVTASDRGEPGRNLDTFTIDVRSPGGQLVFSGGGTLTDGNIQSTRIRR